MLKAGSKRIKGNQPYSGERLTGIQKKEKQKQMKGEIKNVFKKSNETFPETA